MPGWPSVNGLSVDPPGLLQGLIQYKLCWQLRMLLLIHFRDQICVPSFLQLESLPNPPKSTGKADLFA